MGTTCPQPLKIVYNSVTIGNTNEDIYRVKDGTFEFKAERLQGNFSFNVIVFGTSISNLHIRCSALEVAFRDRRKSLTISLDGNTQHSFSSLSATGKNSSSTCTQLGGDKAEKGLWSGYTREYTVSIDIDLPPPTGPNGRTEIRSHLRYRANRERIMTIVAQYNSTSGNSALENYQDDDQYYEDTLEYWSDNQTEWKLIKEEWESPDSAYDVQMTVTREYEELIRKIKIEYGTLSLGTDDPYRVIDGWAFNRVRTDKGTITFSVRVYAIDASALKTACNALEEGFAERRKTIKLYYDGVLQNDFTVSNIYVDSLAHSTSKEGEFFGATSRDYSVHVEVDLPPKNADGITEEDVRVTFTASRRMQVVISAKYNAILGTSAKALYTANFDTYCSGVLSVVGAGLSFNLIDEKYETLPVIDNKIHITRTYEEILFSETESTLNDAAIRGLKIDVTIGKNSPGDYISTSANIPQSEINTNISPKRLTIVRINASCPVEKATDIYDTYDTKLKEYLINYGKQKAGATYVAVVDSQPVFDPSDNTIRISLELHCAVDGFGQVIMTSQTINQSNDDGRLIVPVWDGTKYGAFVIETKGKKIRTVTEKIVKVGISINLDRSPLTNKTGWIRKSIQDNFKSYTIGDRNLESFNVVEHETISIWEWVESPSQGNFVSG